MEKKVETTIVSWRYVGIMEKKMETTIVYWGYIGILEKNMETTIVSWRYIGIMEKVYWGYIGVMDQTAVTIQSPGVCWTTLFAPMISARVLKASKNGFSNEVLGFNVRNGQFFGFWIFLRAELGQVFEKSCTFVGASTFAASLFFFEPSSQDT